MPGGYFGSGSDPSQWSYRDRQNGSYYRAAWQGAIASKPAMVIVTSFNETRERTEIHPTPEWGSLYLDITREMGDLWRSQFPAPPPTSQTFAETGQTVRGPFFGFFNRYGGLDRFGYPIAGETTDGGRTVQVFQRARMERFPENAGTPYEVQLTLLGDLLTAGRRPFPTGDPFSNSSDHRYFAETGHGVHNGFLRAFDARGGLESFGYPISEELYGENGWPYAVQYFQRARFEYHPENAGTPYEVQLGLLGEEYLAAQLAAPAAPPPAAAVTQSATTGTTTTAPAGQPVQPAPQPTPTKTTPGPKKR